MKKNARAVSAVKLTALRVGKAENSRYIYDIESLTAKSKARNLKDNSSETK